MLNWLTEQLLRRVRRQAVTDSSNLTAPIPDVSGCAAETATASETQRNQPSGKDEANPRIIAMPASEELQATCRRNLDEAISQFLRATYGASALLTDWAIIAETVESSLDKDSDEHMVWLGTSSGLSSWRLAGLTVAMNRLALAGMAS